MKSLKPINCGGSEFVLLQRAAKAQGMNQYEIVNSALRRYWSDFETYIKRLERMQRKKA